MGFFFGAEEVNISNLGQEHLHFHPKVSGVIQAREI